MAIETKLAVILHADVVGSTQLVQRDESLAHERIRSTFQHLAALVVAQSGRAHEIRGDALVAEFQRPSDAVSAAMDFQREHAEVLESITDELTPVVRIGIAMGEVVVADDTITGVGVVLAQRLEQLAAPGGVCISAAVREAVPGRLSFDYQNMGEHMLKGFDDPVRVFGVIVEKGGDPVVQSGSDNGVGDTGAKGLSIAVLPFENRSNDPEQEYFADGLAEDIITELSRFHAFLVIARNTTFTYRGQQKPIGVIASELAARYVVVGSVRLAGRRVRVSAQLTDGITGANIWAERYDRNLEDIFAVQDELTLAIVAAIAPESIAAESRRAVDTRDTDLDAWDLVMRARWELGKHSRAGNANAHLHLERALELAPSNASALVYLSFVHSMDALNSWGVDVESSKGLALEIARRAVALNEEDALAQVALGMAFLMSKFHGDAIVALERAVELNPSLAQAHGYLSTAVANVGDYERARFSMEAALRLSRKDPDRARWRLALGVAAFINSRYEEVVALMTEIVREFPEFHIAYRQRAAARSLLGQLDEARLDLARSLELEPNQTVTGLRNQIPFEDSLALEKYMGALRNIGLSD